MYAELGQNFSEGILRLFPHGVVLMILHLVIGVTKGQHAAVVSDAEILVNIEDEIHDFAHLVLDLVGGHEKMRIVLAEVTSTFDSLQRAAGLETEIMGDLSDTDGQIPV